MNKCILARIYKNCKAQCGQYRIQKESMWVNIKWRIILICEESIPARNWTGDLLHPRAAGLPVALPENVYGYALFLLSILSCGSHKLMFRGHGSLKILQLPWALINFQKYKCPHLLRNNIAIIIKASKQWAESSLYVLHHTKKRHEFAVNHTPALLPMWPSNKKMGWSHLRLSFPTSQVGISIDIKIVMRIGAGAMA